MALQMVVLVFKSNPSAREYLHALEPLTADILNLPGLRWMIWLINEVECTAGGLYLFDDAPSLESFLHSPLMINLKQHPNLSEILILPFAVLEAETQSTHGPLRTGVRV